MKREDLEAREFGLIIASSNFPFYAAPEADAVMDAMEARIKELEADAELDQKKRLMLCEGYNRKCERVKELEATISISETTEPKWISVEDKLPKEGEVDEEATLSNLVRTETIYAIKRVVMEKHPLIEDRK